MPSLEAGRVAFCGLGLSDLFRCTDLFWSYVLDVLSLRCCVAVVWAARYLNLDVGTEDWFGDKNLRGVILLMVFKASWR